MARWFCVVFFLCFTALINAWGGTVERIFRSERFTRGNTAVLPVQLIDHASWITHPDIKDEKGEVQVPRVVKFKCNFTSDGTPLVFDVTADERYILELDGNIISRGPHRGTVNNWLYQSYRVKLTPGEHVLKAVVWKLPPGQAPHAQLSYRHGFCLKADGAYDATITTGRGKWMCGIFPDLMKSIGKSGGAWGTGVGFEIVGTGIQDAEPKEWKESVTVRPPIGDAGLWGLRQDGWILYPSQLQDQIAQRVRPGRFVDGGEMKFPIVLKPGDKKRILWDLDRYICAYPEVIVKGGKGGSLEWKWAESLRVPSSDPKYKFKGNRNEWKGKVFDGFGDRFVFDGRSLAVFQPPWFRCGRWCELIVEAGDQPVEIQDISLIETRYPLECESKFNALGSTMLDDVQRICVRTMQMCCHETLFDCPYYEQQMYPGDTRVQLNVISSMTSNDVMIRRAIETFDLNRRDDGTVPFNYPTAFNQEGAAYTLCYLGMYNDYLMNHSNRDWLRARLPGYRNTLSMFELYERKDGILGSLPGWSFLDWVLEWKDGWAPGTYNGGINAELNLFYLNALQGAARIEDAFGNRHLANHWREKAEHLKRLIVKTFFNEKRGLFASDADHTVFAEHAQCLALIADVFTGEQAQLLFDKLITEKDLHRTTVYFSYYLFETYFKFGRGDLFLKRLEMWNDYVKLGATTTLESPEFAGRYARSDCHAWGSHPVWFFRTGIAGIKSAAPFFEKVIIAPQPGSLKNVKASYPHPSGKMIEVNLEFVDGNVKGYVNTPIVGEFVFGNKKISLSVGMNKIH
jgi:hypothetical protein